MIKTALHVPARFAFVRRTTYGAALSSAGWTVLIMLLVGGCCYLSNTVDLFVIAGIIYVLGAEILLVMLMFLGARQTLAVETITLSERFYQFEADRITIQHSNGTYERLPVANLWRVARTPTAYALFHSPSMVDLLPFETFESPGDQAAFEALMRKHDLLTDDQVVSEEQLKAMLHIPG